jgi:hypothetical protein
LVHYAHRKIGEIKQIEQRYPMMKPIGLWVSNDDSGDRTWADVCADHRRPLGRFVYDVTLAKDARVLILKSRTALERFVRKYAIDPDDRFLQLACFIVDWRKVAKDHHGIIITPYRHSMVMAMERETRKRGAITPASYKRYRHSMIWADTWDCASGCIWHPDAIASITLREEPQPCPTASPSRCDTPTTPTRTTTSTERKPRSRTRHGRSSFSASARA